MPRLRTSVRRLEPTRRDLLRHPARMLQTSLVTGSRERAVFVAWLFASVAGVMLLDYSIAVWFDGQAGLGSIAFVTIVALALVVGAVSQRRALRVGARHRVGLEQLRAGIRASARALEAELRIRSRAGATVELEVLEIAAARGWSLAAADGRRMLLLDCGVDGVIALRGPLIDLRLPCDDRVPCRWRVERLRESGGILSLSGFGGHLTTQTIEPPRVPSSFEQFPECLVSSFDRLPPELLSALGESRTPYRAR